MDECCHRFCWDCLRKQIEICLKEGKLINCPYAGCAHILTPTEVSHLCGNASREKSDIEALLLKCALTNMTNVVVCPAPGCKNYIEVPSKEIYMVPCSCGKTFCSICKADYHYRVSCEDLVKLFQNWLQWCSHNREAYHNSQKRLKTLLKETYEKEKEHIKKENKALQQRYQELLEDERYKESHCRKCPSCGRAVEKLEGCDAMSCGRDYHGGNVQNGCGAKFNWKTAQPYKSSATRVEKLTVPKPPAANEYVHPEYIVCDSCKKRVVGLLFSCVNCECYFLCEECEFKPQKNHNKNHCFCIIEKYVRS